MVMALHGPHARRLVEMLVDDQEYGFTADQVRYVGTETKSKDPFVIAAPSLTEANRGTFLPALRILVVPLPMAESFNCQRFNVALEFEAGGMAYKREQFRGRVRRPSQQRTVLYHLLFDEFDLCVNRSLTSRKAEAISETVRQNIGMKF